MVKREHGLLQMEFPAYELRRVPVVDAMGEALGAMPSEAYVGRGLLCIFDDEETVRNLHPDMSKLLELDGLLVHVTAPGG